MVKVIKREILKFPKVDKKQILTTAEIENNGVKRFIYYLSYIAGSRRDKQHRINKKTYDTKKSFAKEIITQSL